jgi:hypothetical protein
LYPMPVAGLPDGPLWSAAGRASQGPAKGSAGGLTPFALIG